MRNHNPKVHYMRLAKSNTPELRYDGNKDFCSRQKRARENSAPFGGAH